MSIRRVGDAKGWLGNPVMKGRARTDDRGGNECEEKRGKCVGTGDRLHRLEAVEIASLPGQCRAVRAGRGKAG